MICCLGFAEEYDKQQTQLDFNNDSRFADGRLITTTTHKNTTHTHTHTHTNTHTHTHTHTHKYTYTFDLQRDP